VKRGGSLSFLVGTISNVLVMKIGWTDVGSGGYILVSHAHSNTKSNNSGTAKVKIVKNERDPPLFTSKQLIKF
jgi:NADH:ubiquinone oxidoreductase subunit 5 (subunit L)/multisubunit Na+/H+ antiporter MnhA subunit